MISDRLYELVFEFKKTKLWEVLWGGMFFAVKLSGGRTGYVRMIRENKATSILELYIGEEGLESLRLMIKAEAFKLDPLEYQEASFVRDCLQCAFVGKEALTEEEREEVKVFARSHGIRIAGKNAYPKFIKFQPYYCPWHLQTVQEQEDLCEALSAAVELSELLKQKTPQELGLQTKQGETGKIILLERREDVFVLGKTELMPEKKKEWPMPEVCNDISVAKLKKVKKSGIWECGFVRVTEPVQEEDGEIPVFPILLFVINSATGYMLPLPLTIHYEDNPEELMNSFMEALLEENICPVEIKVKDSRTYAFFQPFCKKLKISIAEEEYLPALEDAEDAFYEDFGMDVQTELERVPELGEEEAIQSLTELLDIFLKADIGPELQIPEEILNQFSLLLENGNLPKELEDKVSRFLALGDMGQTRSESAKPKTAGRPKLESVGSKMAKEAKGKSYVISVSLGAGCYRHIQISCNALLLELHFAIIDAFGFDDDHAHAFFMDNKIWSDWDSYYMEGVESGVRTTRKYRLSQAGLCKGMKFKYLFDFGDEWVFQCKVLKVVEEETKKPVVVKIKGEAPEQYPDWDDDWDDE